MLLNVITGRSRLANAQRQEWVELAEGGQVCVLLGCSVIEGAQH
jgi:hypothetical protein